MPGLDVSFVLVDPLLIDRFDVRRNAESVGENGRPSKTAVQTFTNIAGVVIQEGSNTLERRSDFQMAPKVMEGKPDRGSNRVPRGGRMPGTSRKRPTP